MTKTEACRRVAQAALLAATLAGAHEARAGIASNGVDLNGFADRGSALPDGGGPGGGAAIAAGTGKPDPVPTPKRESGPNRGPGQKRASDLGGVTVAAGTQKPEPTPNPK